MTDIERAETYIGIFVAAGEKWRSCAPVDGRVRGDSVHLGEVVMTDGRDGTWTLAAPGRKTMRYAKAAPAERAEVSQ
jgi:hypothetical protein